jgi:hypothetical protein
MSTSECVFYVYRYMYMNWFVEQKLVEGWFDPRFSTIQVCVYVCMDILCVCVCMDI